MQSYTFLSLTVITAFLAFIGLIVGHTALPPIAFIQLFPCFGHHIDTAQQLLSYEGSLETEMSALLEKRKELYSKSRSAKDEDTKSQVKAELSDISKRLSILRKEVKLCEGIAARSDTLKEKLAAIRADEQEQQRKELTKNEHRRRSGRTNRPNELGGL